MSTKKMLANSGIYTIVSILQKCIGLFLLPVYTSYLTKTDYGITGVVQAVVSLLTVFYMLSLNGAISRYYFDYKDDREKLKEFWGTNILFVSMNSIFMSIIIFAFHRYIISPFVDGISFFPYFAIALISITLNPIYNIFQSTLQAEQNGKQYGLNNLSYFTINLLLTITYVVGFKMGAKGVLLALASTDIIFFIYTLINFIPKVKLKINKIYLKQSLRYSLPLIPHSLSGWMISMIDRLFLNKMQSTEAAGSYNIAFQFGNIMNILTTAVNQAYVPWFFDKMNSGKEGKKIVVKFTEYVVVAYGLLAMLISLFGQEVINILISKKFEFGDGWKVVPVITFAFVFNGLYYFFVNPLFYNKKGTKFVSIGTIFSAIANSVLNYLLIPKYGTVGSAVASLISMFMASVLILIISSLIEKVGFNYVKLYLITFLFMIVSSFCFLEGSFSFIYFFLIKLLIAIVVIVFLSVLYKKEVNLLIKKLKSFVSKTK
ncbi:polysaccharide biosynthesis protein [Clostridium zeae]|uniref:Polysaccharide biosynthesis protein n=1 Tax=Clostridium zeae TaxID=2759022 RepID=A0ABQ1EG91_9CLOT|nr:oligosaccharide flippase family protein [Clostridium zeae]GFZ33714.1 polysaccharide biosynthesis protein [Clostridium zeae]